MNWLIQMNWLVPTALALFTCAPSISVGQVTSAPPAKDGAKPHMPTAGSETADHGFACTKPMPKDKLEGILQSVEKRYQSINDLRANFVQLSSMKLGREERSKGEVFFKKPGKMDWQYTYPEPKRFVADGENLWSYEPAARQATVGDFSESFQTNLPVSFLIGIGKLHESFRAESICKSSRGLLLNLKPLHEDKSLEDFSLAVDEKSSDVIGAKVIDVGGNITTFLLLEPVYNSQIGPEHFMLEIPKGVDIIDYRSNAASTVSKPIQEKTVTPKNERQG